MWIGKTIQKDLRGGVLSVDLQLSKALFSFTGPVAVLFFMVGLEKIRGGRTLIFSWVGALFCCSFFCPLFQACKTLETV